MTGCVSLGSRRGRIEISTVRPSRVTYWMGTAASDQVRATLACRSSKVGSVVDPILVRTAPLGMPACQAGEPASVDATAATGISTPWNS